MFAFRTASRTIPHHTLFAPTAARVGSSRIRAFSVSVARLAETASTEPLTECRRGGGTGFESPGGGGGGSQGNSAAIRERLDRLNASGQYSFFVLLTFFALGIGAMGYANCYRYWLAEEKIGKGFEAFEGKLMKRLEELEKKGLTNGRKVRKEVECVKEEVKTVAEGVKKLKICLAMKE